MKFEDVVNAFRRIRDAVDIEKLDPPEGHGPEDFGELGNRLSEKGRRLRDQKIDPVG